MRRNALSVPPWIDPAPQEAFCFLPRPDIIDFKKLTKSNAVYNLQQAFNTAEQQLGLAKLLDPEGKAPNWPWRAHPGFPAQDSWRKEGPSWPWEVGGSSEPGKVLGNCSWGVCADGGWRSRALPGPAFHDRCRPLSLDASQKAGSQAPSWSARSLPCPPQCLKWAGKEPLSQCPAEKLVSRLSAASLHVVAPVPFDLGFLSNVSWFARIQLQLWPFNLKWSGPTCRSFLSTRREFFSPRELSARWAPWPSMLQLKGSS